MKIISQDEVEKQFSIQTESPKENAKLTHISNPHNITFKCNADLSLSQYLEFENFTTKHYQNVCVINLPFFDNFCHNIIDILPELIHIDNSSKYDLILAKHSKITDDFINTFKIKFQKIKFVKTSCDLTPQSIDLYNYYMHSQRQTHKSLKLRETLLQQIKITPTPNKLIYCTRNTGGGANHGRKIKPTNEDLIIKISKEYAKAYDLDFVIFDGCNEGGSRMSIIEQANLFSRAKIVAGPHGGAFANIIYIPTENHCKVCEFTSGKYTAVQSVPDFGKNYNRLLGFAPQTYLDYYLIPFEIGSNAEETFINIDNYKSFMQSCSFNNQLT